MRYDVLKPFEDKDFKVRDPKSGEKVPLEKAVGEVFIPAEINYPDNTTAARVADGTLKLIVPELQKAEKVPAKAKA